MDSESNRFLSVDAGSSFLKAATASASLRFPSLVVEVEEGCPDALVVEGRSWLVAEAAMSKQATRHAMPHASPGYHGSIEQRVLICEAIRRLGGGNFDTIVLNLPCFLGNDTAKAKAFIEGSQSFAWRDTIDNTSHMGNVRLVPQGRGAIWSYLAKIPNRQNLRTVCAVDIGGSTTDVVTIQPGEILGRQRQLEESSGSCGVNVAWFWKNLVERIQDLPGYNLVGASFPFYATMRAVEMGESSIRHDQDRIDITLPLAQAKAIFTDRLKKSVLNIVGEAWADLDLIILTGGGAALIDDSRWRDSRIVTMPSVANVEGQQHLLN